VLHDAKLCLDGGSAVTGIVTGVQIEDGRYRIIRACVSEGDARPPINRRPRTRGGV